MPRVALAPLAAPAPLPEADEPEAPASGGDPTADLSELYAEWHRASGKSLTAARAAAFADALAAGADPDDD